MRSFVATNNSFQTVQIGIDFGWRQRECVRVRRGRTGNKRFISLPLRSCSRFAAVAVAFGLQAVLSMRTSQQYAPSVLSARHRTHTHTHACARTHTHTIKCTHKDTTKGVGERGALTRTNKCVQQFRHKDKKYVHTQAHVCCVCVCVCVCQTVLGVLSLTLCIQRQQRLFNGCVCVCVCVRVCMCVCV